MMMHQLVRADCRDGLPLRDRSVHCCITSPPYWGLRDYGLGDDQLGLERIPDCLGWATRSPCNECYVCRMVGVFREVGRVLRDDGTLFLNLADTYSTQAGKGFIPGGGGRGQRWKRDLNKTWQPNRARIPGIPKKSLVGIPWRVALAMQADGWILRSDVIWSKPSPMPESVQDRPTRSHEHVFLFAKSQRYYYDATAIREPLIGKPHAPGNKSHPDKISGPNDRGGHSQWETSMDKIWGSNGQRNKRDVWHIATAAYPDAHFATFPTDLVEPCLLAGTSAKGVCGACGAPWGRIVETHYDNPGNRTTNGPRSIANRKITAGFSVRLERRATTTGWEPTCSCNAGRPVPATVLDPFVGSGTVLAVAKEHGRHAIGIEMNPEYIQLGKRRIARAPAYQYSLFN